MQQLLNQESSAKPLEPPLGDEDSEHLLDIIINSPPRSPSNRSRRATATNNHIKEGRTIGPANAKIPLCGWLHKSGNTFMAAWKRRYFVLDVSERVPPPAQISAPFWDRKKDTARLSKLRLFYYLSKDDPVPKGFIDLTTCSHLRFSNRHKIAFDIVLTDQYLLFFLLNHCVAHNDHNDWCSSVFHLRAETKEEAEEWLQELNKWVEWARGPQAADEDQQKNEGQRQKRDKGRRRAGTDNAYKHDGEAQHTAPEINEAIEHKERELCQVRREKEKLMGVNIEECSLEELEELEAELLSSLVRVKSMKKKRIKEDRDSTKIDLLQACFVLSSLHWRWPAD